MACQRESRDMEVFTIVWWNTAGVEMAIPSSMTSSIALLFAASGPVKHAGVPIELDSAEDPQISGRF